MTERAFHKVLVANRGEVACRIVRTLRRLGIRSVAVYSEADAHSRHVREADEAISIGASRAKESYLNPTRILEAAQRTGAQAIHPGYGFLSENADFAQACGDAGMAFIGPTAEQIRVFGRKHLAREIAERAGVPLVPGTSLLSDADDARSQAERLGYPVMLKSTAGGGGIGLRICHQPGELAAAFEAVERLGALHFGGTGAYLEKLILRARHIEVQIFGDGAGNVLALGDRDCSAQRRHQKVVEETPAPNLSAAVRQELFGAAISLGRLVRYASAGTVEFVLDADGSHFYFLEVNTRLQVEHPVTEEVLGIDLVEWMIRQAEGRPFPLVPEARGAAIEARIYAEDPGKDHQPSSGVLTEVVFPPDVRVDSWIEAGTEISPHYDPMLAKIVARGETRAAALANLARALSETRLAGVETNVRYLRSLLDSAPMQNGRVTTETLAEIPYPSAAIDVIEGGMQTTVQDYPGRLGLWAVGVPPSGPMDDWAFCVANRMVGNEAGAPALEITLVGPTLRFRSEATIALTGAAMTATINGNPMAHGEPLRIPAGAEVRIAAATGRGARTYLAVRGGFDVPRYLGSASTFMLGRFGGHGGRALRAGDVLHVAAAAPSDEKASPYRGRIPEYPETWELGVLLGPHAAPDFFTADDIQALFGAVWQVHYNSDRTGIRLVGPKPRWARTDGGEAGLHPSNIHDNAYAIGTVDYTGDMPVVLGPDGPSLGGFVCPITIVRSERWKMGQLKAGDRVRFVRWSEERANAEFEDRRRWLAGEEAVSGHRRARARAPTSDEASPILGRDDATDPMDSVVYRRDGDDNVLVEYGPPMLDLGLRLRVHALMQEVERRRVPGLIELTPGIRSLQIHYDPVRLPTRRLLALLRDLARDLPRLDELSIPARVVHLPLSWEDPATLLAIEKYMRSVRSDAPWCPSNIEFIRRINGLASVDDVRRVVFDASYLVLGLGDVYLGAPVATPLDPCHRLVTTKYNPARTWTPENAVGIGGAYLCIYGMEGPGGYQFVGRTLQVWNTYRQTSAFRDGKPYLLRFFDQIRFFPVEAAELLAMRAGFPYGGVDVRIEPEVFRYGAYRRWIAERASAIAHFKTAQQAAFDAERERWRAAGQDVVSPAMADFERRPDEAPALPLGSVPVTSAMAGSIWKVLVEPGTRVQKGDTVIVLEAMKMEVVVPATASGIVTEVRARPQMPTLPGQILVVVDPSLSISPVGRSTGP
ncbi:MAG TPA: urea carboxylase [Polyangiaceae bacterium]|nr:urea carboxylase [Polyangiaceae bacterium]